ncbi:MAG TPA: glycerol-3-phosphate dehydrogenase [Stellaceae bacterium]|nr:glycerol-3-phosphate dehydrogenase [Stellaceae bacterium]
MSERFDLAVIGGGINGVGIARDAAGRGLRVFLCDKGDLAGATSSASSKMIHGGLRYLEQYDFKLVRESLAERAVLLRSAPHLVRPMRFVLPHAPGLRPRWMMRAGLFLYDHLGGAGALPGTESIRLADDPRGAPLNGRARHGFVYSDCVVDDARLTVAVARDAALHGAEIATRTALVAARRGAGAWHLTLGDGREIETGILVNAAGPWAAGVQRLAGLNSGARLRLVKGSHVVTRRLYDGDHAYLFQNDDRRVLFVIPYERDFTLVGTTDIPYEGDPADAAISDAETEYLLAAASRWLRDPPREGDIVWRYAGVRPLYDDGAGSASAVTRDYVFDLDTDGAPALSVFGGKLTTFRRLAEHALDRLGIPGPWTATATLPRGREVGDELTDADLRWFVDEEWARTAEDVLWRRTKLGLTAGPDAAARLSARMAGAAGLPAGQTAGR